MYRKASSTRRGEMRAFLARFERLRGWWVRSLIVFFVVTLASVAYLRHRAVRGNRLVAEEVPLLGPSAIAIVPGLYLLGGLSPGVAYAVETSRGLVLIDSGLDTDASILKSQLASLGLDWRQIHAVLLTHAHGDHCGGAEHLRSSLGATIYAGQGEAAVLRAGEPREAFFSTFHMPGRQSPPDHRGR